MSNMNKLTTSRIELLPDELWLEVFAYTRPLDLYYAWRNLNSHINAILRSIPITMHIGHKSNDDNHHKKVFTHFALQTVSVKDDRYNMMTSSSSWFIDLLPLVNLRSLYLAQCSKEQFKQLANMRQLTRLSLPCNNYSSTFLDQFVLGKEEERFPHLQSIGRIWCNYTSFENFSSTTVNTKIRHIHIVVPSCSSPANLIHRLPQLDSITVDYLGSEIEFPSSCFILAKLRPQRNYELSKVSLKMDSSSKPIDQKNLLLIRIAPYVYSLEIDFNGHCDFIKLAQILERCSNLERIQIRVKYYPKDLDLDSIRQLNLFFVNFTFGDVHQETGNPVIMTKWSL